MFRYLPGFVCAAVVMSTPAYASGLGGLFNALNSLANGNSTAHASPSISSAQNVAGSADVVQMLEVDHPGEALVDLRDACTIEGLKLRENYFNSAVSEGDRVKAAGLARSWNREYALCARLVHEGKKFLGYSDKTPANYSFSKWVMIAGSYLANYVLISDTGSDVELHAAERAKAYLEFADANGELADKSILDALNKKFFEKPKVADTLGSPKLAGTAVSLVSQYLGNRLAFKQKYTGALLEASGAIGQISDDGGEVRLIGNTKLSRDEIGFQHYVYCTTADGSEIRNILNYRVGQKMKVRGIFDPEVPAAQMFKGLLVLRGCRIVN